MGHLHEEAYDALSRYDPLNAREEGLCECGHGEFKHGYHDDTFFFCLECPCKAYVEADDLPEGPEVVFFCECGHDESAHRTVFVEHDNCDPVEVHPCFCKECDDFALAS